MSLRPDRQQLRLRLPARSARGSAYGVAASMMTTAITHLKIPVLMLAFLLPLVKKRVNLLGSAQSASVPFTSADCSASS
eukprot:5668820-Pleurochrysis_carterae.AAC.1